MIGRRTTSGVVVLGFAWVLALGGDWLAVLSSPASAAVVADLRGNWVSGTTAGQTTLNTNPLDYTTLGRWDYFRGTNTDPSIDVRTPLKWDTGAVANGGNSYDPAGDADGHQSWADVPITRIAGSFNGLAINANEVALHTGANATNIPLVYKWTAGNTVTGATIAGQLRKTDTTANANVTLYVYKNNTLLGSGTAGGATGTAAYQFSFTGQNFVVNDNIYIYADRAGAYASDASALKAAIYTETTSTWTQTGDGSWGTGTNWDLGTAPTVGGDKAVFGSLVGTDPVTVTLDGVNPIVTGLTFDNASRSFAINQGTGGTLTLGAVAINGIVQVTSGSHSIGAPLVLGGEAVVTVNSEQQLAIGGAVNGAYSLTKAGAGTLTLGGAAPTTPIPALIVNGGTVRQDAVNAVGSAATVAVTVNGTTAGTTSAYNLNGVNQGILSLTLGGVGATATSTNNVATGAGTLTLAGNITYDNTNNPLGSTISGNLNLGTATRTFTVNDSTNATTDLTVSAAISGTGGLTKSGAGTLLLSSSSNSYSGTTTINGGALTVGANNALGAGNLDVSGGATLNLGEFNCSVGTTTVNGGTIAGTGILTFANSLTLSLNTNLTATIDAQLAGTGKVVHVGGTNSVMYLNNSNNSYTGGTDVGGSNIGVTRFASGALGTVGNITFMGTVAGKSTLQWATGNTQDISSRLVINNACLAEIDTNGNNVAFATAFGGTSTGGLTKLGAGTLTLSAANTYSGDTTLGASAGTLLLTNANAIQNSALNITGSTLVFDSSVDPHSFTFGGLKGSAALVLQDNATTPNAVALTVGNNNASVSYTGALSGPGSLTKIGTGTQILTTGTNIYAGGTTISAGTLQFGKLVSMPASGTVAVGGTGTLAVNVGGTGEFTNAASGNGSIGALLSGTGGQGGTVTWAAGATLGLDTTSSATFTYSNAIANPSGNLLNLAKLGTNTLILGGANTYTGKTTISGGTVSAASLNSVNGGTPLLASSSLGAPTTAAAGTIDIGLLTTAGQLTYTGTGETTDRVVNLAGTTGGATIDHSGTGLLKFTSDLTATGVGAKILTLQGSTAGTGEITSAIASGAGVTVVKSGTGQWTLSGANTYNGTTRADQGTLVLAGTYSSTIGGISVNNVGAQNAVLKIVPGANIAAFDMLVGQFANSRGAVYQSGGSLTLSRAASVDVFKVGAGNGSWGYYQLSDGSLTVNEVGVGALAGNSTNTTGVMDVTGGTLTSNGWICVGRNGGTGTVTSAVLNVTGGLVEFSKTTSGTKLSLNWAALNSLSVLNVKNASVVGDDIIDLAAGNGAATTFGIANLLSGGVLQGSQLVGSYPNPLTYLNFNGGTLKAHTTNAGVNFMPGTNIDGVYLYSGGGTIHDNGTAITVAAALLAPINSGVSSIAVTNGGSGYIGAPMVKITGGTGAGATAVANMVDDGTNSGTFKIDSITITSPGVYTVNPTTVTLVGGGASSAAIIGTIGTAANTSGGLTKDGSGTLTLSSTGSTYTGGTTVNRGTLSVSALGNLGANTVGNNITVNAGGILALGAAAAVGSNQTITVSSSFAALGGIGLAYNSAPPAITDNTGEYGGVLAINTTGFNAVTDMSALYGGKWFLGSTSAGTLASASLAPGAGNVYRLGGGGGTLTVSGAGVLTDNGGTARSATIGSTSTSGGGTVILGAAQSYTGGTAIAGAALQMGAANVMPATGAVSLTNSAAAQLNLNNFSQTIGSLSGGGVSGGSIALGTATLTFGDASNTTYSGTISGAGALVKQGSGRTAIDGTLSHTGGTTISAGTLAFTGAGALPSGKIVDNGTLELGPTTPQTFSSAITGTGDLVKSGSGTLSLTGGNDFGGSTTISAGTLQINTVDPVHRWSFNDGTANDSIGTATGTLYGTATISGGQLRMSGSSGNNRMVATLNSPLGYNKTLVSWFSLASLTPNNTAGGPLGVESDTLANTNTKFDAIDYGERTAGQWCAGSDFFRRSNGVNNSGALETVAGSEIMIAITYDSVAGKITLYRNGVQYAQYNQTVDLQTYTAVALAVIGPRAGTGGYFNGSVNDDRIYDRPLSAAQIAALYADGPNGVPLTTLPSTTTVNITAAGAALDLNGAAQTIKSLAGVAGSSVTLGAGTLTTGGDSTSTTFHGVISGNGGLVKQGGGVFTLAGTNSYTGPTTINAGTLAVNGQLESTGTVAVNAGATLAGSGAVGSVTVAPAAQLSPGSGVGTLTAAALSLNAGSILNYEFNASPAHDLIVVQNTDGLNFGTVGFRLYQEGTANTFNDIGVYNLIQYSGAFAGSLGSLSVLNETLGRDYSFDAAGGYIRLTIGAGLPYWSGGAEGNTDFRWSLAANWSNNAVPATDAVLVFGGERGTTNINDLTDHQAGGILFKSSTSNFSLGGNAMKLAGDIINRTAVTQTVLLDLALVGADRTVNTDQGNVILAGDLSDGDGQARGLVKTGNAALTLRGDNFHTGTTTVSAGTLELYSAMQAMGGDLAINGGTARLLLSNQVRTDKKIVVAGGTLDLVDKNNTVAGVRLASGQITGATGVLTSATTIDLQSGTASAILDCPLGIAKTTAGTVVLSGANTFIGGVSIGDGTLRLGSASALNVAMPNAVAFTAGSTGTLQLGGNTITVPGLTTDSDTPGTAVVENASATPAVLTVNVGFSSNTFAGALKDGTGGGALGLTKGGAGNLILSGANTLTGALSVNAGTLTVRSDLSTPASATITGTSSKLTLDGATLSVPTLTFNGGTLEHVNDGKFTAGTLNVQGGSQITTAPGDAVTTAINIPDNSNSRLTLGGDLSPSGTVYVGIATSLDLGGKSLTAGTINLTQGTNLYRSGGGEVHAGTLRSYFRNPMVLGVNDTIANLDIQKGGSITTVATGNVSGSVDVLSDGTANTNITLGAPLVLTNHLALREAVIYDKGYDVTVGTLTNVTHLFASEPNAGDAVREGGIFTVGAVSFGRSSIFPFRPGDRILTSFTSYLQRTTYADFTFYQDPTVFANGKSYDVSQGLSLENSAANALTLPSGGLTNQAELSLKFDAGTSGAALDWGFRWLGDHVSALNTLYTNQQIKIDLSLAPSLTFDPAVNIWYDNPASGGDGYTYVGYRDTSISVEWDHTGSGTWATAANWTTDTAPGNAGDTATFGNLITDASAVVDLNGATPKVRNLIFNNTQDKSYEIAAPAGGTLTLQGQTASQTASIQVQAGAHSITAPVVLSSDTTVTVADGLVFTLGGNVSGTKALTKDGPGMLVLNSGTNAWAGTTTISAGTVKLGASGALPHGAAAGNVALTGTLDLNAHDTTLNGLSGAGAVTSSVAGNIALTLGDSDAAGNFSGVIENGSGTVNLVKTGSGAQTLGGVNTYTGTTTVSGGTLALGAGGSINLSPTIQVNSGAILDVSAVTDGYHLLSGQTLKGAGTVNGAVTIDNGAVLTPGVSGIGTLTMPGDLTINGTYAWQMDSLTSYDSIAVAAGGFTFDAGALLQLSYTGGTWNTAITAGDEVVLVGSYHALTPIPAANIQATGFATGTFSTTYSDGNLLLLYTPGAGITFSGSSKWTAAGGGSWGVGDKWTDTEEGHGSIHQAPGLGAQPEIAQFDAGATAGTASVALDDGDQVIPVAVNPLLQRIRFGGDTAYTIQRGGVGQDLGGLTLQGVSGGAAAIDVEAGAAAHEIAAPITLSSDTTVTTADNAPTADLTLSGPISGSGVLTKAGAGTLVLSSSTANNYGGTVVTGGTLVIGSAGALPSGRSLSIGSGGALILGGGMAMGQAASAEPVPEPGTLVLLTVAALAGVLAWRRRR